ncbi:MAG: hypothetical protein ACO3UU_15655, partial [Minisyncoccia bacterium]
SDHVFAESEEEKQQVKIQYIEKFNETIVRCKTIIMSMNLDAGNILDSYKFLIDRKYIPTSYGIEAKHLYNHLNMVIASCLENIEILR